MPKARPRGRPVQTNAQYRGVADQLRKRLAENVWKTGEAIPSQRKLAAEFNVGSDVIRAALEMLRQEERITRNASRRLVPVPLMAQLPYMSPQRMVLLVYALPLNKLLSNPSTRILHNALEQRLGVHQIPFLVAHSYTMSSALPDTFLQWPIKGMVLYGPFEPVIFKRCERLSYPVVLLDQPAFNRNIHSVSVDNVAATRAATERLIKLGHKQIAFIRLAWTSVRDIDPDSKERQQGFEAAMRSAKLKGEIFTAFSTDTSECRTYQAIANPAREFTAAVCVDLTRARWLGEALQAHCRNIPEHFSLVCFQSVNEPVVYSGPCLDFQTIGTRAADLLQLSASPPRHELIAPQWREGYSIARPLI